MDDRALVVVALQEKYMPFTKMGGEKKSPEKDERERAKALVAITFDQTNRFLQRGQKKLPKWMGGMVKALAAVALRNKTNHLPKGKAAKMCESGGEDKEAFRLSSSTGWQTNKQVAKMDESRG